MQLACIVLGVAAEAPCTAPPQALADFKNDLRSHDIQPALNVFDYSRCSSFPTVPQAGVNQMVKYGGNFGAALSLNCSFSATVQQRWDPLCSSFADVRWEEAPAD